MLDWEGLFKRYVWDDRKTPYLVPVSKLNRRQADNEILAYSLFVGILFAVVALSGLTGSASHGRSPFMMLYGFSVVCAAVLLHYTKSVLAAFYLAATPVAGLAYLLVFGLASNRALVDTVIVAAIALLLLWYSWRLVNLTRAYPALPDAEPDPPRRRLFK